MVVHRLKLVIMLKCFQQFDVPCPLLWKAEPHRIKFLIPLSKQTTSEAVITFVKAGERLQLPPQPPQPPGGLLAAAQD